MSSNWFNFFTEKPLFTILLFLSALCLFTVMRKLLKIIRQNNSRPPHQQTQMAVVDEFEKIVNAERIGGVFQQVALLNSDSYFLEDELLSFMMRTGEPMSNKHHLYNEGPDDEALDGDDPDDKEQSTNILDGADILDDTDSPTPEL